MDNIPLDNNSTIHQQTNQRNHNNTERKRNHQNHKWKSNRATKTHKRYGER